MLDYYCTMVYNEKKNPKGRVRMLKPELIQSLKKSNISKNAEKTKERVRAVWAPLVRTKRNAVLALADMKQVTVQRAYKFGGISARVALAMAQILDIDPRWLTGETDEKGVYDVEQVIKYLKKQGYDIGKSDVSRGKVSPEPKAEAKPAAKAATKPATKIEAKPLPVKQAKSQTQSRVDKLTEDEVVLLVRSLTIQAEYSAEKQQKLSQIKSLLLQ
jgi:hypothetical protein